MADPLVMKIDVKLTRIGKCRLWLAVWLLTAAARIAGNAVQFDIALSRARNGST